MRGFLPRQLGFGMIEVLVSLIIIMTGLLGLAGLITQGQQAEMESYQRAQALILLQDMANRINANRKVAQCYVTVSATATDFSDTELYFGKDSDRAAECTAGTAAQNETAIADMQAWDTVLKGAAETSSGASVGAMIGARGCVSVVAADTYMVSVAWQGLGSTFAQPSGFNCAKNLYGNDAYRRVVSTTVRVANLSGI